MTEPVSRKRTWLVRTAAAVAAVILLVVVPGYIASQPQFTQRYGNMADEYATWETSVHAKASCQSCHVDPDFTAQTAYSARMLGEFYVKLVARSRQPDVLATPTNDACSACHIDLRTVSPSGDLLIPHRAHVDVLGLDCIACHDFLVHEQSPEGGHAPRMVTCMECHDGEQAKDACTTCHTEKAAPESHQAEEWLVVHADARTAECDSCHGWTDDWCVECHTRRPASHGERWRSTHRDQVEQRRNCEACHEGDFCIRCHGVVPSLNLDPALALVE